MNSWDRSTGVGYDGRPYRPRGPRILIGFGALVVAPSILLVTAVTSSRQSPAPFVVAVVLQLLIAGHLLWSVRSWVRPGDRARPSDYLPPAAALLGGGVFMALVLALADSYGIRGSAVARLRSAAAAALPADLPYVLSVGVIVLTWVSAVVLAGLLARTNLPGFSAPEPGPRRDPMLPDPAGTAVIPAQEPSTPADPTPLAQFLGRRSGKAVVVVVAAGLLGSLIWINVPRPVRADLGLVPGVDRFSYASWDSDLLLSSGPDGRPVLRVTETITASFPDSDQNKGIVRGVPTSSSFSIDDVEVVDGSGRAVPFETDYDYDNDVFYVLTGTEEFVRGDQTYEISYSSRDGVTADDENDVEDLYWNLLPLDSAQRIEQFSATIRIAPDLTDGLTGDEACYQGRYGSTDPCELRQRTQDGAEVYSVTSGSRAAGDGVSVAVGFAEGTFPRGVRPAIESQFRAPTWVSRARDNGTIAVLVAGLGVLALLAGRRTHRRYVARLVGTNARGVRPVTRSSIEEATALPPPIAAAVLAADRGERGETPPVVDQTTAARAELARLAVRGAIRLEGRPSSPGSRRGAVTVRCVDPTRADHPVDTQMMAILFPDGAHADTARELPRKDAKFASKMRGMTKAGRRQAAAHGLLRQRSRSLVIILALMAIALPAVGTVMAFTDPAAGFTRLLCLAALGVAIVWGYELLRPAPLLTQDGRALRDQLNSLEPYLQAREKAADDTTIGLEPADLELSERLLPHAVVLGLDRAWGSVLEDRYGAVRRTPDWVKMPDAPFQQSWRYLDDSVQSVGSYVPPSTGGSGGGGSSGGSSGGGFSGGGGGGGFSGGR